MSSNNDTNRVKHLEMAQSVIARMAETSAAMKRYAVITFAVGMGLLRFPGMQELAWVVPVIVLAFWSLDAQYLRQEKWFRKIYEEIRLGSPRYCNFELTPDKDIMSSATLWDGVKSWSTWGLYLPLLVISVTLWLCW